jgi:hypothetical protein
MSAMKQRIYIDTSKEKDFDTVAFFRSVKEKMAKATEDMSLAEEHEYWRLLREGKIKLT